LAAVGDLLALVFLKAEAEAEAEAEAGAESEAEARATCRLYAGLARKLGTSTRTSLQRAIISLHSLAWPQALA